MKKRITLAIMRKHDLEHDDCTVRLIEMILDGLIDERGWIIQFWKDVGLYGIDEAMTYLRNQFPQRDYRELDDKIRQVKDAITNNRSLEDVTTYD